MDPEVVEAMMEAVVENRRLLVRVSVGSPGARSTLPSTIILPLHTPSLLMYCVWIVRCLVYACRTMPSQPSCRSGPGAGCCCRDSCLCRPCVVGIVFRVVRTLLGFLL